MNLFIFILIQYFDDFHIKNDNTETFQGNFEIFKELWDKITVYSNGEYMIERDLLDFFSNLPPPLGYSDINDKKLIYKHI